MVTGNMTQFVLLKGVTDHMKLMDYATDITKQSVEKKTQRFESPERKNVENTGKSLMLL